VGSEMCIRDSNQTHYKLILTGLINISKMDKKGKAPMLWNC
jgi:hypothetical protein